MTRSKKEAVADKGTVADSEIANLSVASVPGEADEGDDTGHKVGLMPCVTPTKPGQVDRKGGVLAHFLKKTRFKKIYLIPAEIKCMNLKRTF